MDLNPRHGHGYPGHGHPPEHPDARRPGEGYADGPSHSAGYPSGGPPIENYPAESYRPDGFGPDDPADQRYAGRFVNPAYSENAYNENSYEGGGYPVDGGYPPGGYPEGGGYQEQSYPDRGRQAGGRPGDDYPTASYPTDTDDYRDGEYLDDYSNRGFGSSQSYPSRPPYPDSAYTDGGFAGDDYAADAEPATMLLGHHGGPEDESAGHDGEIKRCPVCLAENYTDARYCDACGFAFTGDPVSGGDEDHREIDLGPLAGVCDRGVRHTTNEDSMGVAIVHGTLIAVVCDGVSTTPGSGEASAAAAATATAILADAVRAHGPGEAVPYEQAPNAANEVLDVLDEYAEYEEPQTAPRRISGGFGPDEADAALQTAVEAAQATIAQLSAAEGRMAPSCTIAAAIITPPSADGPGMVTVGWVGDSRVYLLGPRWCERLTADDTWAAEAARAGLIPASEAETHRRAHTLTRWLGGDAEDVTPHTAAFPIETPATVIVCSDGLWNYASRPDVLASLVNHLEPDAAALDVARHLTEFAIGQGGHDNITVVAARVKE